MRAHELSLPDSLLDACTQLVANSDPAVRASLRVHTALVTAALRRGRWDYVGEALGHMRSAGLPLPVSVFNAMIDAAGAGPSPVPASGELLTRMRSLGVSPDAATFDALFRVWLHSASGRVGAESGQEAPGEGGPHEGSGAAAALLDLSSRLGLPLSQKLLGRAAFFAAKHGNGEEVERVVALLPRLPAGLGATPRWLRKLTAVLGREGRVEEQRKGM